MKIKVILLETKDNLSNIWLMHNKKQGLMQLKTASTLDGKPMHIYLIDKTAEIKTNDFKLDTSTGTLLEPYTVWVAGIGEVVKIIASTDSSLGLPLLSKESIKLLIDYYNKNGKMPDSVDKIIAIPTKYGYKELPKGTIDISIPEDRMYTKDEVMNLIEKYEDDMSYYGRDRYYDVTEGMITWMRKNLN